MMLGSSLTRLSLTASCLMVLAFSAPAAQAVELKKDVVVTGPSIMLGDLFGGVSSATDIPVAAAPLPGQNRIFDARTLVDIARQNKIDWPEKTSVPQSTYSVVTRSSKTLVASELEQLISEALPDVYASADKSLKVRLDNRGVSLQVPAQANTSSSLTNWSADNSTQRFSATLVVRENNDVVAQMPISGRLVRVVSIPVLARSVRAGDVISADDVTWQDEDVSSSSAAYIGSAEAIIGKTPRQALQAGVGIKPYQLLSPAVVTKGSLVTMIYHQGGLQITAQGRALTDAALGETVRVANLSSSRTVEAQVEGPSLVRVGGSSPLVLNRN